MEPSTSSCDETEGKQSSWPDSTAKPNLRDRSSIYVLCLLIYSALKLPNTYGVPSAHQRTLHLAKWLYATPVQCHKRATT